MYTHVTECCLTIEYLYSTCISLKIHLIIVEITFIMFKTSQKSASYISWKYSIVNSQYIDNFS